MERALWSGRTIQLLVCCAYTLASSMRAAISFIPLRKISRSPLSLGGYWRGRREEVREGRSSINHPLSLQPSLTDQASQKPQLLRDPVTRLRVTRGCDPGHLGINPLHDPEVGPRVQLLWPSGLLGQGGKG